MNETYPDPNFSGYINLMRIILMGIISILIIISNLLNVTTLRHVRELNKIGKLLLTNLGFADLLVGAIICVPGFISCAFGNTWLFHSFYCQVSGVLHGTSCAVSIWTLASVGSTRYIAVLHPLKYITLTQRRCGAIIAAIWMVCLLVFLIPIFIKVGYYYKFDVVEGICGLHWEFAWFCVFTGVFIPVGAGGVILFTTFKVLRFLREHRRPGEDTSNKKIDKEKKSIRLLVTTSSIYFIAWGPYVILVFLVAFIPSLQPPWWIRFFFMWLANSNSFVNVLIYSSMYDSFRARVKHNILAVLCCGRLSNRNSINDNQRSLQRSSTENTGEFLVTSVNCVEVMPTEGRTQDFQPSQRENNTD